MRWRPYYKKDNQGGYEAFIPANAKKSPERYTYSFFEKYLWMNNIFKTYRLITEQKKVSGVKPYSGYFDASIEEQKAATFFIDKLIKESKAKKIILVAIPRRQDFLRIAKGADQHKMYWHKSFENISARHKKDVIFLDLADYKKPEDSDELFMQCDGHWSAEGNEWAADVIASKLKL